MRVFYHLQGENGEDAAHPNMYEVPKEDGVLLRDVRESFPLRHFGTFHFRFRIPAEERGAFMWLDVTQPSMKVPTTAGAVHAKVLRLGTSAPAPTQGPSHAAAGCEAPLGQGSP